MESLAATEIGRTADDVLIGDNSGGEEDTRSQLALDKSSEIVGRTRRCENEGAGGKLYSDWSELNN